MFALDRSIRLIPVLFRPNGTENGRTRIRGKNFAVDEDRNKRSAAKEERQIEGRKKEEKEKEISQ